MMRSTNFAPLFLFILILLTSAVLCNGQGKTASSDAEFGPVMRAYLGYLRNEQEVVDDRASRREITQGYYRRNSNRIHALREMAIRIVHESKNDYVPELEAVTPDEFGMLFEQPLRPATFHANEILADKFRFLGTERLGETFYVFARLDPYEQAELIQHRSPSPPTQSGNVSATGQRLGQTTTRARRASPK